MLRLADDGSPLPIPGRGGKGRGKQPYRYHPPCDGKDEHGDGGPIGYHESPPGSRCLHQLVQVQKGRA